MHTLHPLFTEATKAPSVVAIVTVTSSPSTLIGPALPEFKINKFVRFNFYAVGR